MTFFFNLLDSLTGLVSVHNPVGLVAIASLAVTADLGVPVPFVVEPALFLLSYSSGPLSIPVLVFVAALHAGRQIGTGILYLLSYLLGSRVLDWLRLHFKWLSGRLDRTARLEDRLGSGNQRNVRTVQIITVGRLIPGLLPLVTIAYGSMRRPFRVLGIATVISGLVYDLSIVLMGYLASIGLKGVDPHLAVWIVIAAALLLIFLPPAINMVVRRIRQYRERV